ncbi:MAG: hypothetical protein WCJ36_01925 [Candidatus Saccharibacteria bacterium]
MNKILNFLNTRKTQSFLLLALLSILLALVNLGFSLLFWIIMILWIMVYLLFFIRPIVKITAYFLLIITIVFIFSILVSFRVIFNNSNVSTNNTTGDNSLVLDNCTSTASDTPVMVSGWKSSIYAAPLLSSSPNPDQANNIRTFSYSGIKNKTEANSLYARIEKADGSYINGYGTAMEVCDANNKATQAYTTTQTTYVSNSDVVASVHYFHGGNYLHGAGDYRADVYLKTTDGKWHLIDRMGNIKVTE